MVNLKDYAPFTGLLIFGNIENLILASQGAVAHVDPYILAALSSGRMAIDWNIWNKSSY